MNLLRVTFSHLLLVLTGCGAETAEYFCEPQNEGPSTQTVIVDYVRGSAARCPKNLMCRPSISTDFIGDLVVFSTEYGENQLNTRTGEFVFRNYRYQCSRMYF